MRKLLLVILGFIPFFGILSAQDVTVSGKVISAEDGLEIIGATIVIKGNLTSGTITDFEGNYQISAAPGDTLLFSFIGFATQEIPIGSRTSIDISMSEENILIEEVVVTALGMKREKKALGYSVQEVDGEEFQEIKELDIVNSLSGKVAGVNITQAGGALGGGGARIVIRGETSLAGNNDPLFVIDGIPGSSNDAAPDDIESISILKGPAAAALYGSRAAAGVVLITTKTGKGSSGVGIVFNTNNTWQSPLVLPEYQNDFGQGKAGRYSYYDGNNGGIEDDTDLNWGPGFDGEDRPQFTGNDPWIAHPDNVKDFYQTGYITHNNIAMSGGSEQGDFRFSYSNVRQKGIIPNTGLTRNRFDLNGGWVFSEKLSLKANMKYTVEDSDNNRSYDPRFLPRSVDFNALEDYWVPGEEGYQQLSWRRSSNNPYFLLHENTNSYKNHRMLGSLVLNYDFTDHLSLMARAGTNVLHRKFSYKEAFSTAGDDKERNGSFGTGRSSSEETNADLLLTYDKYVISDVLSLRLSAGGNHMRIEGDNLNGYINQLVYFDIFNLGNYGETPRNSNSIFKKEVNSLYGFANLGYKHMVYLDITGRNDWSSTLPKDNNSYFYPSFALTGLMSEIFTLPSVISFWKLRGSWAMVGNDTDPYKLETTHDWKDGETAELEQNPIKANPDLKPELTRAIEFGTDIRFWKNRLMLDITYYNSVTSNQILRLESSIASRYKYWLLNAGEIRNYGLEVMVSGTPVQTPDIEWNIDLNWSFDRAYIEELLPGQVDEVTQRVTSHLFIIDKEGERRGAFYGKGFQRAPDGQMLLDISGDTKRGEERYLGNYNPDWMASLINSISYKGLALHFMFDYRYGGAFYSNTLYRLNIKGLAAETTLGDREGIVPDGVVEENGVYRQLTIDDLGGKGMSGEQYWANMMDSEIPEAVMVDGTYLKLRELKLSYAIPPSLLKKTFIQAATISLVGRNLVVWTGVKHVDPETFGIASEKTDAGKNLKVLGYDSSGIPSVRNIGFNINLKF